MKTRAPRDSAFSLVEVSLALAIVAFAFLGLIALLPVGLKSVRESNVRSGLMQTERTLAEALRAARFTDSGEFFFSVGTNNFSFRPNTPTNFSAGPFTAGGTPAMHGDGILTTFAELEPGTNRFAPGRAIIHTAWPATATRSGNQWQGAEGSATRTVIFFPR